MSLLTKNGWSVEPNNNWETIFTEWTPDNVVWLKIYMLCIWHHNNFMSFRSNKSGSKGKWDKNSSTAHLNNTYDEGFRREDNYLKKGSYPSYIRTKDTAEDAIGNIGNPLKSTKSSKKAFLPENMLELSRTSFYEETSILQTKNNKITDLYDELSSK